MKQNEELFQLWLDVLPGLGPRAKLALAAGLGSAKAVCEADWDSVRSLLEAFLAAEGAGGGNRPFASAFNADEWAARSARLPEAERILREMERKGIDGVTPLSDRYPQALSAIYDPPWVLYYQGNLDLVRESPCVAVVGARKASPYGRWAAGRSGEVLGGQGVTVVSGMAQGVDSCAHLGALSAGGSTAAVLGCGVDVCYPRSGEALWKRIRQEGVLLSEYPPGTPPAAYRFPRRNRIISGLSVGVVVAEAGEHSGSLITAGFAAEQGREVFAIPANINGEFGLGTNQLIRDGAVPICSMGELSALFARHFSDCSDRKEEPKEGSVLEFGLGEDEVRLYRILRKIGEADVDQLCRELGRPASEVNGLLTVLEIKGIVHTSLGKIYIAK